MLKAGIRTENFDIFRKMLKPIKALELMKKPIDFSKEHFNGIDNKKIIPEVFFNGAHKALLALLSDMHGTYRVIHDDQLQMLESLLREENIEFNCHRHILNEMSESIDFYILYFFLDAHAIALWDDFELEATALNESSTERLKGAVLSTTYREALRPIFDGCFIRFDTRSVVQSCAHIEEMSAPAIGVTRAAQLLKKEAYNCLLKIAYDKKNGIPAEFVDEFIDIIAMRLFMKQENIHLQEISKIVLNDLKKQVAQSEDKSLAEVFNEDITQNFVKAVTDCVDQNRTGTFFNDTDLSFYQASNLVKFEQNLPTRPQPPAWVSEFFRAHPLCQQWHRVRDNLEIERSILWRMEVHEKILSPIHAKRHLAFVPWFLNHQISQPPAPLIKSTTFEPQVMEEIKELLGSRDRVRNTLGM